MTKGQSMNKAKHYKIINLLSSNESRNIVLKKVIEELRRIFKANSVIYYEYNESLDEVKFPVITGSFIAKRGLLKNTVKYDFSTLHRLIKLRKSYFAEDSLNDPMMSYKYVIRHTSKDNCFTHREKIKSSCAIMIGDSKEILGVLLYNFRKKIHFSSELKESLEALSSYIAVVQNATQSHNLTNLFSFSLKEAEQIRGFLYTNGDSDYELILIKKVLNDILGFFNEKMGYFAKYNPHEKKLTVVATSRAYKELLGACWPTNIGLTGKAVREKENIIVSNIEEYREEALIFSRGDLKNFKSNVDENLKSSITVPIYFKGKVFGVFHFESEEYNNFSKVEAEIIRGIGSVATDHIQLIRTTKKNDSYNRKLLKIRELDKVIASKFDLDDILDKILEIARIVVTPEVDRAHIALIEYHGNNKYVLTQYPKIKGVKVINILLKQRPSRLKPYNAFRDANGSKIPRKRKKLGLTQYCILANKTINLSSNSKIWKRNYIEEQRGIKSELVVPIKVRGKPIGVINLESKIDNAFVEDDEIILRILAGQAVIILEFSNILENMKKINLASLEGNRDEFIKSILKFGSRILGAEHGIMWDFSEEKKEYIFGGWYGPFSDIQISRLFNIKSESIEKVIGKGQININQVDENLDLPIPDLKKYFYHLNKSKFQSTICIPLISQNKTISVMSFYLYEKITNQDWEKSIEKSFIELFASQAAVSMQMFKYIEKLAESFDLAILNDISKMILFLVHRLNGSVGGIQSDIRDIIEDKQTYVKFQKIFDRMLKECRTTLRIPSELEEFSDKILKRESRAINVFELIHEMAKAHDEKETVIFNYKSLAKLPLINGNREIMREIFHELTANAIRAMPKGGKISITGKKIKNKSVVLFFKDTGNGIDYKDQNRIFEWGYTGKSIPNKENNQGKGLSFAKMYIDLDLRGSIDLLESSPKGTTFIIELPTYKMIRKKD